MRKVAWILLSILLLTGLTIPAFAADSVRFSIAASQSTVQPGDTVTITVSVSSTVEATSFGLKRSYDTSVFEEVPGSGSCIVPALVASYNNGFAFMFSTPTAYSGTVGTVTLKVKDDAPVGTYTISGTPSVKNGSSYIDASADTVTITISCNHSYGNWTQAADGHSRVCSLCGDTETAAHQWNGGKVTQAATCQTEGKKEVTCSVCGYSKAETVEKTDHSWDSGKVTVAATCKADGVKTYTCTVCKTAKTESIPKKGPHQYGPWQKRDADIHVRTCSICQATETQKHTWNSGVVTQAATCKESGEKTFSCTACNATKTEKTEKLTTHTWGKWSKSDASFHKHVCTVCQKEETAAHTYGDEWHSNSKNHWQECTVCKEQKDLQAHIPGPEATETQAQTCKTCQYIIKPAINHMHQYAADWQTDEIGHWHACDGCEEQNSYGEHTFDHACDPDCNVCAYLREITHSYGAEWIKDNEKHWKACTTCADAQDPEPHAYTKDSQVCVDCGYVLTEEEQPEATQAMDENQDMSKKIAGSLLRIGLGVLLLLGSTYILAVALRKHKTQEQEEP